MKKLIIGIVFALMIVPMFAAAIEVVAPVWRLTSMCDAYNGDAFAGHIMRARSESTESYNGVTWSLVGSAYTGSIDLPGMDPNQHQVYFLVPEKGTVKLNWYGYETVKAMNTNVCSDVDECTYLGGKFCPDNNDVPEFGLLGALAVLGLAGLFIAKRRQ